MFTIKQPIPQFLRVKYHPEILMGFPEQGGGSNKRGVEKTSHFLALCANISKMVKKVSPKLLLLTNRKLHMHFQLASRSMTLICNKF